MNQYYENEEGDGLRDIVNGVVDRLKGFNKGVRLDFPPKERGFLKSFGNYNINRITVYRSPIYPMIDKALNVISFGEWDKLKQQYSYDKMFHLYMIVQLDNPQKTLLRIEKHEVVTISNRLNTGDEERISIDLHGRKITLNELLNNTIVKVGRQRFFVYSPWNENCQRFLLDILESNGLLTEQDKTFIYQDISELIQKLPSVTKAIGQKITDTAHAANILIHGQGIFSPIGYNAVGFK